jgi:hypothetical protein
VPPDVRRSEAHNQYYTEPPRVLNGASGCEKVRSTHHTVGHGGSSGSSRSSRSRSRRFHRAAFFPTYFTTLIFLHLRILSTSGRATQSNDKTYERQLYLVPLFSSVHPKRKAGRFLESRGYRRWSKCPISSETFSPPACLWCLVLFGFFRTAGLGLQYTTWCHEWVANFYIYRHKHFSVYHIRRVRSLSSKSVYPGLFHPVGFSCVWARTPSLFLVLRYYAGLLPALYYRLIAMAFWGP